MTRGSFDATALTAIAQHYVNANRFMGNVLIAQADEIVYEASFGYANLELNVLHHPLTKFRIASVTKPFTAAAIMVLEGRGLLRLTDTVDMYLPDFPDGEKITVQHLLNHTSGIVNFTELPELSAVNYNFHALAEVIALFAGKPLEFEPGSQHAYSNSNYVVLTAILESVTKQSYADALRELVLEPLGLQDTGVDESKLVLPNRASGYFWASGTYHHAIDGDMSVATGAGAMYSTTKDLQRFARGLCTGKLLGAAATERVFTLTAVVSGDVRYGLGWTINTAAPKPVYWHGGAVYGFRSELSYFPDSQITVVILSNRDRSPLDDLFVNLAQAIFELPVKLPDFPVAISLPTAALEGLSGRYQLEPTVILEITVEDATLRLFVAGQGHYDVYASATDHFFLDAIIAQFSFERDANGVAVAVTWMQNGDITVAPRLEDGAAPLTKP